MHSTVSDGSLEVGDLVRAVHEAGVSAFALTDHDSVDGLVLARKTADAFGLRTISGIEVSTHLDGAPLHILGYGFDPEHTPPRFGSF
jgi:predicted metal-dependent phosphoesterase TrpH